MFCDNAPATAMAAAGSANAAGSFPTGSPHSLPLPYELMLDPQILRHPQYPQLVAAVCACRQILASSAFETSRLEELMKKAVVAREGHFEVVRGVLTQPDLAGHSEDPELDHFMEQYIKVLDMYRKELSAVVQEVDELCRDFDSKVAQLLAAAVGGADLAVAVEMQVAAEQLPLDTCSQPTASAAGMRKRRQCFETSVAAGSGYPQHLGSAGKSPSALTGGLGNAWGPAAGGSSGNGEAHQQQQQLTQDCGNRQHMLGGPSGGGAGAGAASGGTIGFGGSSATDTLLGTDSGAGERQEAMRKKYADKLLQLQQEFSRKRRKGKLPNEATNTLRLWWDDNTAWPYPTEEVKVVLMEQTGLDSTQVNNWFINQRKRHWDGARG